MLYMEIKCGKNVIVTVRIIHCQLSACVRIILSLYADYTIVYPCYVVQTNSHNAI
jgi:hypothetical protein